MTTALDARTRAILAQDDAERLQQAQQRAATELDQERIEQARQQRLVALRRDLPKQLDRAPLDEARAHLAAALGEFVSVCAAYDRRFADAYATLLDGTLGPLPADLRTDGAYSPRIIVGDQTFGKARPQLDIHNEATAALQRAYPRQRIDLGRPQD